MTDRLRKCALAATILLAMDSVAAAEDSPAGRFVSHSAVASSRPAATSASSFPALRDAGASLESTPGDASGTESKVSASAITVSSSLAVVLGLFAGLVWMTRKFGGRGGNHGGIPKDVLQPLGSTALDSRTRLTMIRCGNRIVVVAQSAQGIQPVAEITSPDEVRELTAACLGDSKQAFAATLKSIEQERSAAGFVGKESRPIQRARGRLFASA